MEQYYKSKWTKEMSIKAPPDVSFKKKCNRPTKPATGAIHMGKELEGADRQGGLLIRIDEYQKQECSKPDA